MSAYYAQWDKDDLDSWQGKETDTKEDDEIGDIDIYYQYLSKQEKEQIYGELGYI